MYGLAVNLTMSVSGHPSIINKITQDMVLSRHPDFLVSVIFPIKEKKPKRKSIGFQIYYII